MSSPAARNRPWTIYSTRPRIARKVIGALVFVLIVPAHQLAAAGVETFINNCVLCHAGDGKGTNRGPSILEFVRARQPSEVAQFPAGRSSRQGHASVPVPGRAD